MYDLPVHNGQEPDDLHAFEPLALGPLGDVEQERVKGQEDKPDAYRVGQEKGILERPDVDPGGRVEDLIQGTSFRRRVGRPEEEAYGGDAADDCGEEPYAGGKPVSGDEVGDG